MDSFVSLLLCFFELLCALHDNFVEHPKCHNDDRVCGTIGSLELNTSVPDLIRDASLDH